MMVDFFKKLLVPKGGVSSVRLYSGLLIFAGIIYGCCGGNPENVRTFIYSGAGLLGGGKFAERIGDRIVRSNYDGDQSI